MADKTQLIPFVVESDEHEPEVTHYTAAQLFGGGVWRPNVATSETATSDNVITMHPDVPRNGEAFGKWLAEWHAKNNGVEARYVARD